MDIDKDKMTLTIRTGEESTEKTRSWQLEVVGVLEPDGAKGYVDPERHCAAHSGHEDAAKGTTTT